MLQALKAAWPTLVTGLGLTALITGAAHLAENQSLQQRAKARADLTLKRAIVRLQQEGNHVQNVLAFIDASKSPNSGVSAILDNLNSAYLKPTSAATWIWVRSYPAGDTAAALQDLAELVGKPTSLSGASDQGLLPVVYAYRASGTLQPGYNLASEVWVGKTLKMIDRGAVYALVAPGESTIWPQGALVVEAATAGSLNRVLRVIPKDDLATVAYLSDDQTLSLSDERHPDLALGDVAPANANGISSDVIAASPKTTLSIPVLPGQPVVWIPVMLVSLMMTGLATVFHASQILRDRASITLAQLSGTQSTLADTQMSEQAFFETSGTANFIADVDSRLIVRANDTLCELLGYSREELLKLTATDITHPDDVAKSEQAANELSAAGSFLAQFEKRYLSKSGDVIWCVANSRAYRTSSGKGQFACTIVDISARKEAEMRRDDLVRELAHRVRNTVQLVASLARQTAKSARSVADYDHRFQERLVALKAAQDSLFETAWGSVQLTDVAARTLEPFTATHGERLKVQLPNLRLDPQQAQTMAIALHELAANSSVHGALGHGGSSELRGQLQRTDEGVSFILEWEDHNPNLTSKPKRKGFGTRVLQDLFPSQFGGTAELHWNSSGVLYHAELPVSHQAEA
ncbi:sensor histidine kinase [Aestuariivirga litoralis]|uniref:sensor histidine kinase n=1 Tax=Aestuariivirga litoralis TaxID=2650924 RepID=UPI0018C6992D|nr:HWE histidine kinase domain-containing protein [Aestuariivirga litoralis]MBG1232421.1 PAS domain S-box protein [Aestuariivirga litoralis]